MLSFNKLLSYLHFLLIRPFVFHVVEPVTGGLMFGGNLVSGLFSSRSSKKAARIQAAAIDRATAENRRQFNVAQENLAPYRDIGKDFLPTLRDFMRGDYGSFLESPDYKFVQEQGEQALQRKQSAAGSRYGGGAIKEALQYNQGLASTQVDKFFNKLFNVVGMGQNAAAGVATAALQTGRTNASLIAQGGMNAANLTMQGAAGVNNAIQSGIGNLVTLRAYNRMFPETEATT